MLGDKNAMPNVAVRNLDVARKFYGDILGLKQVSAQGEEAITFKSGNTEVIVYRSPYAGTNKATVMSWNVGNQVDELVRSLKTRGVVFERYDMPDAKHEGEVHVFGEFRVAWFKDPDGNILSLMSS